MAPLPAHSVPRAAAWLGAAGLLPFAAGALGLWLFDEPRRGAALSLLLGYSAVILAFMGAVHWGLAMRDERCLQPGQMAASVIPALLAWLALALPPGASLVLFAAGFAGVYALDEWAIGRALAPRWYRRLRVPLTAGVIGCLALAFAALRT